MPARRAEVLFADVSLAAGLDLRHDVGGNDLANIVEAVGAGASFVDLDGDGWIDVVWAGGAASLREHPSDVEAGGVRLYRNQGDGTFTEVTEQSRLPAGMTAVAVAVADYDGDGDRDLYVVDRGPNRLYRNRGDGVFDDVTGEAGVGDASFGVGASFFDMEGDGDLDLFVANYLRFDERQDPYYSPEGFPGPLAYAAEPDTVYRNLGNGVFEDATADALPPGHVGRAMSVATADLDVDGDIDIFVANDATGNFLWLNDGTGRFTEAGFFAGVAMGASGEQTSAMAADLGDIDGDGALDLAVSDTALGALYMYRGGGLFVDEAVRSGVGPLSAQYVSWGQNLIDYDNDGDLDLFVVNGGMHHLVGLEDLLLRNDGTGRFEDAREAGGEYFDTRRVGRASVAGDYDNDGDLDLLVTALEDRTVLLRNDGSDDNAWISLDLRGPGGTEPFGARVRVGAAGREWVAESRNPSGYLGQGDSRLHLGLGSGVDSVDWIEVAWPDGTFTRLENVPARQVVRIEAAGR